MQLRSVTRLMVTTVLAICASAFLLGQIGNPWYLELLSHFQLQYALAFGVMFLVFSYLREWGRAGISFVLFLITLSLLVPYFPSGEQAFAGGVSPEGKRLMFYNMWVGNVNYDEIITMVREEDPDVLFVAEVAGIAYNKLRDQLVESYPYSGFENGPVPYLDISYFSKEAPDMADVVYSTKGRIPSLRLVYSNESDDLVIYGVHTSAPLNGSRALIRDEHLSDIAQMVASEKGSIVVVGDLNITPWSPVFKDFIDTSGLVDVRLGRGLMRSWSESMSTLMRIPIDHALVSKDISVLNMRTGEAIGSDHRPIIIDIDQ